ncbi:uncharacterized protein LOC123327365 [Drosophila simulans]|uniref:uncharacterized protein LOC123327365 n=1 Tax=Drosophila simulans TaxID=7240 RepID=UPI00078AE46E|nr:uncharacterized protein LOC123327365 [Drosophila simulans]KMZ10251.1 uncharacterized protein Dsimw501_GD28217, isoform A [Drosophila simulans]
MQWLLLPPKICNLFSHLSEFQKLLAEILNPWLTTKSRYNISGAKIGERRVESIFPSRNKSNNRRRRLSRRRQRKARRWQRCLRSASRFSAFFASGSKFSGRSEKKSIKTLPNKDRGTGEAGASEQKTEKQKITKIHFYIPNIDIENPRRDRDRDV